MESNQLKHKVVDYIEHADDYFISMVSTLIDEYEHKDVVGYSNGKSVSKDDLVKRILQASKRVKSGKFISQESLENEVANW